jgi:hypothetical protein
MTENKKILKARDMIIAVQHKLILTHYKINLLLNSFPHPQQKAASREGGLAS